MSQTSSIQKPVMSVEPKKLMVWLFAISISMIFLSLSSAYIVRRAEGNWLEFDLPLQLMWSTLFIVISSGFMYFAQKAYKNGIVKNIRIGLILATLFGLLFSYYQYLSWTQLQNDGVYLTGPTSNPSGSFVFILIWTHLFHIVSGLIFLIIVLFKSFTNNLKTNDSTVLESCAIYWHFLGLLWIYLYIFLYFYH